MSKSTAATASRQSAKPDKPRPDFPLFPHATRRWAKKIKGRMHYFGPWADSDGALRKYLEQKDYLEAGMKPPAANDGRLTVRELCNRFLNSKRCQLDTRELSPLTFHEYVAACKLVVKELHGERAVDDLRPEDFERMKSRFPRTWGPHRRGKMIQMIRTVVKYAMDEDLVEKTIKVGKQFKKPTKTVQRIHRAKVGKRMFAAAEIHALLGKASVQMRAMILLGINCGYGNTDVATLPVDALDLVGGWATFARPKTGIPRRCPLWKETAEALRIVLAKRPTPKEPADAKLVFLTRCGHPWARAIQTPEEDGSIKVTYDDALSKEMPKLIKAAGMEQRRGTRFYALRHGTETIGGEAKDPPALDLVMGHADPSMGAVYREEIGDDRLRAVTDHIRTWLFSAAKTVQ
jgi:integrase